MENRKALIGKLFERISEITRDIGKSKGHLFEAHSLSRSEGEILFLVAHSETGRTVKELAKALKITHGAVSQFLDAMMKKELVIKETDYLDKRSTRIRLSQKAIHEFKEFEKTHFAKISNIFDDLEDLEIEQLIFLLKRIKVLNE